MAVNKITQDEFESHNDWNYEQPVAFVRLYNKTTIWDQLSTIFKIYKNKFNRIYRGEKITEVIDIPDWTTKALITLFSFDPVTWEPTRISDEFKL